ncbi:hypothetical protein BHM03_00007279 [Ensete ventricosum]|uniref:Uncharacterized protein n=1 Tax=Ensete ventricosum TaxID=4639 RepID=A0A445MC08_ENSVE|nr:hypothetical protein BHM03_00007279 [Ensete ventricosum]
MVCCTIVGSSMPMLGRFRCGRSGRARGKFLRSIFGAPVAYRHEVPEDLEVMKVGHDLDTAVTRGHLLSLGSSTTSRLSTGSTFRGLGSVPIGADRMDLDDLYGMPKVSGGKTHAARPAASVQEVGEVLPTDAPRSTSKRSSDAQVPTDDPTRRHKKVKILSRRHKSHHDEGRSWSHSKGKEPAMPIEDLEGQAESPNEIEMSVFVHPKSTKVRKNNVGYYALYMSDLAQQDPDKELRARWENIMNSSKVWRDHATTEEFKRGLLHPQLARELYTLLSEVLLA